MLNDVLKDIMNRRNISIQQMSDLSGVPMETVRNIYYNKVRDPKATTVLALSQALGVSMNFLMGESIYDEEEKKLILNYRNCGIHGQSMIRLTANFEYHASEEERDNIHKHRIPCLIPLGKVTDGIIYNSCNVVSVMTTISEAFLAIEITTNHFAPAYCKGDRVLFESRFPDNNERAVFMDGGKCYFRRYMELEEGYCLKCINGHGQDIYLKRMDAMECMGTCIGVIRV